MILTDPGASCQSKLLRFPGADSVAHLALAYQSRLAKPRREPKKRTEKRKIQPSLMSIVSVQSSVKSDKHLEGKNGNLDQETYCQKLAEHKGNE